jgi:small subunit ribosomal protein S6
MQHYELLYIIPSKYTEEETNSINEQVLKLIEGLDGKITYAENLGKMKLAYPIKHFTQGCYSLVNFDAETASLEKINTKLKLMPEVIRHLIVKRKPKTVLELQKAAVEKEKKKERKPARKISAEELDEKLDKILQSEII